MTTPAGFAAKCAAAGAAIPGALPAGVFAAGKAVAASVEAQMPTKRLRNVGSSGARVGAFVRPPKKLGRAATALVAARGPFHLIERSIGGHLIEPRAVGAAVNNPLAIPGSETGFAMSAQHPGVARSVGPFERGAALAAPLVPRIIHKAAVEAPLSAIF